MRREAVAGFRRWGMGNAYHGFSGNGVMQTGFRAIERVTALEAPRGSGVGIVVVFQDPLTRQWATDALERVSEVLCREEGRLRFWRMDDLAHPLIADAAIRAAAEATILMVSLRDAAVPPPSLCVWNEGWLAKRLSATGLLVSIVGVHPRHTDHIAQLDDYLRAIALRGSLDYLPRQQLLPPEAVPEFGLESLAGRANATTHVMGEILHQGKYTRDHQHWGINE